MALIAAGARWPASSRARSSFLVWMERRFIARLQDRLGPNRVGQFGLLQSVADALKLLAKEIIMPARVDQLLHFLARCWCSAPR